MQKGTISQGAARGGLIAAMAIFGTIGIFVRGMALPSGVIALVRGCVGAAFLLLTMAAQRKRLCVAAIRKNLPLLGLSGAAMGFNWILLFEAYRHTTVATATLCYYLAPVFVVLASPLLLRERLSVRKLLCALAALAGMALASGAQAGGSDGKLTGTLLGLGAAALYACVVLINKRIPTLAARERTIVQLVVSAAVMLPYTLAGGLPRAAAFTGKALALLLVVGIVHTGLAYALYFGAIQALPAQTAAIFSFIDPVVAILLSAALLGEPLRGLDVAGGLLVLGAAFVCELPEQKPRRRTK